MSLYYLRVIVLNTFYLFWYNSCNNPMHMELFLVLFSRWNSLREDCFKTGVTVLEGITLPEQEDRREITEVNWSHHSNHLGCEWWHGTCQTHFQVFFFYSSICRCYLGTRFGYIFLGCLETPSSPPISLFLFNNSLRRNSHTIHFTHLQYTVQWFFSISEFCSHHHNQF